MGEDCMPSDFPYPKVTSSAGTFKGSILKSFCGQPFAAFRGIPFALPPVGPLRFARPQAHPKLEGDYDATKEGPISIQPVGVDCFKQGQEDCLYLNVFLPAPKGQIMNNKNCDLKKVMVYIHGGGFFMGCANQHMPGDFVAQGDVIVVTINHRLSWLGFFKGPIDELQGNMGMWDQLMALKWVKDNIRSFGGDPDDITLAGQSMGGESVSALSISPCGKDLFSKGILMSGTMFSCQSTRESSDFLLDKLAETLGLPTPYPGGYANLLETLRQLPEERFHLPYDTCYTRNFTSVDGDLFPDSIQVLQRDEDHLKKVGFYERDYLVTLTNNEGQCLFCGPFMSPGLAGSDEDSEAKLASRFMPRSVYRKALESYSHPDFESRWPKHDVLIDPIINLTAFQFLAASSEKVEGNDKSGKSYFLWFDHMPTFYPSSSCVEGTPHSIDLCYLFDITPNEILKTYYDSSTEKNFTEDDKRLKSDYIKIISEFMRNGNPNALPVKEQTGKEWPEFESNNEHYLSFSDKSQVKQFPMKKRRALWTKTIPKWIEEAPDK